jgi:geranylgeranyl pyrophosphate synthase
VVADGGRRRAVETGDLLFSRAFAELLNGPGAEPQVAALATASVALAQGELAQRQDAFRIDVPAERYLQRCRLKTAALFECACVIGRQRPAAARAALRRFGGEIGLAFQLLDDVLDVVGPPERTGKARGTDLLDGTVTLPLIRARERDPELAAIDLGALDGPGAERLSDRIAATGATDAVRDEARERVERAKRGLRETALDGVDLRFFELVADGVVERYS